MTTPPEQDPWFPIRTERLLLRELQESDLADVHEYACDPAVSRYMDWGPNTEKDSRDHLDRVLKLQQEWPRNDVSLAIVLAAEGKTIGSIRLGLQPEFRSAEFGYCLHSGYWRRGLGYEATLAMVTIAFETLGLHRVWATCDVRNRASFGIMEKLGMRREGTLRKNQLVRDGWRDTHLYALLDEEWAARRPPAA
jgi:RimJ/RimL family protein N-acetyltransferase